MDSGTRKVARDLVRLQSLQHEANARVGALERTVGEQGAALESLGGGGSAPGSAEASAYAALARYVDWVPPAFGVWFLTGGDGKVGVHVPERCVTYNGEAVEDDKWIPDLKKGGPENRVRYCELDCGEDKEILFFVLYCIAGKGSPAPKRPWRARLLWAAKADDVDGFFTDEAKVLKIVPVASYDDGKERLVQLHVGVLSLDGAASVLDGPFEPVYGDSGVKGFSGGYVQVGGFTVLCSPPSDNMYPNPATAGQEYVAVRVSASGSGAYTVELVAYSNDSSLRDAQQDLDYVVYPIYRLSWDEKKEGQQDGQGGGQESGDPVCSIAMDLRRMPTTGMLETFLLDDEGSGSSSEESGGGSAS